MKVLLKRNWFNPKGYRMRVTGKGTEHEMPEEWRDQLPSTAVILSDEEAPVIPLISNKEPDTFSEMNKLQDGLRDSPEAIAIDALAAHRKEQTKRNRQAGAAKAREKRALRKEEDNVQMD